MTMSSQVNHSVNCGEIASDNRPTQFGLQVMLVHTAGYVSWKVQQSETL